MGFESKLHILQHTTSPSYKHLQHTYAQFTKNSMSGIELFLLDLRYYKDDVNIVECPFKLKWCKYQDYTMY